MWLISGSGSAAHWGKRRSERRQEQDWVVGARVRPRRGAGRGGSRGRGPGDPFGVNVGRVPLTAWGRGWAPGPRLARTAASCSTPLVGLVGLIKGLAENDRGAGCQEWIIPPPRPVVPHGPKTFRLVIGSPSLSCPRPRYAIARTHPHPSRAYGERGKETQDANALTDERSYACPSMAVRCQLANCA